jgi:hypothetical protein
MEIGGYARPRVAFRVIWNHWLHKDFHLAFELPAVQQLK